MNQIFNFFWIHTYRTRFITIFALDRKITGSDIEERREWGDASDLAWCSQQKTDMGCWDEWKVSARDVFLFPYAAWPYRIEKRVDGLSWFSVRYLYDANETNVTRYTTSCPALMPSLPHVRRVIIPSNAALLACSPRLRGYSRTARQAPHLRSGYASLNFLQALHRLNCFILGPIIYFPFIARQLSIYILSLTSLWLFSRYSASWAEPFPPPVLNWSRLTSIILPLDG